MLTVLDPKQTKQCTSCKQDKASECFHKRSNRSVGYVGVCKNCRSVKSKLYYQKNQAQIVYKSKQYRTDNPQKHRESTKQWTENNKTRKRLSDRIYTNNRMKNDIEYRLSKILRGRLNKALRNNYKSGSAVKDLGCSVAFLKNHIESKFQPGMSWENYGRLGWHIDHIKPLASFDLTNPEQFKQAVHYTNLQPLWWHQNTSKGDRF